MQRTAVPPPRRCLSNRPTRRGKLKRVPNWEPADLILMPKHPSAPDFKKLFTYSPVENEPEPRYSFFHPRPRWKGLPTTPGRTLMTKSGLKPTAGKSNRTKPSPQTKPVITQGTHIAATQSAPKALQPTPAAKQPVVQKRSTPWTVEAASRVYRTSAKENGGQVPKGSLAAEAMSRATKGTTPSKARTR
ncbi:hypothetical protein D3C87_376830 [compost metagenome]